MDRSFNIIYVNRFVLIFNHFEHNCTFNSKETQRRCSTL